MTNPTPTAADQLAEVLKEARALSGGWKEAVCELEDFCSEPVRLKNMLAARDGIERFQREATAALRRHDEERGIRKAEDELLSSAMAIFMVDFDKAFTHEDAVGIMQVRCKRLLAARQAAKGEE